MKWLLETIFLFCVLMLFLLIGMGIVKCSRDKGAPSEDGSVNQQKMGSVGADFSPSIAVLKSSPQWGTRPQLKVRSL